MKLGLHSKNGDDVRAVWVLALAVLGAGSYYVQTQYQAAISRSYHRAETLYREAAANERIIRDAGRLRVMQQRAEDDLARISHDTSLPASTASLLSMLQASARQFGTRVTEVQPGAPAAGGGATTVGLAETPLTVRVSGKFRDILNFIEDLSHHRTLINVSDTEMNLSNDGKARALEPGLDATIHATLYRLHMPEHAEVQLAAPQ
jgi:Tfp pilus assembly protein PilO